MAETGSEKSIYQKAQEIFPEQLQRYPQLTTEGIDISEARSSLQRLFNDAERSAERFFSQCTYPGKENDNNEFIATLESLLRNVLSDNKLTGQEFRELELNYSRQTNAFEQLIVSRKIEHDKSLLETTGIEASKEIKEAKFDEAVKRFEDLEQRILPFYKGLIEAGPGRRSLYEGKIRDKFTRTIDELAIMFKEEELKIIQHKLFYEQVFKVFSDPAKDHHEIIGLKGPNCITAKDSNGNITLEAVSLNSNTGRLERTGARTMNWLDLMMLIERDKHDVKKINYVENTNTTPPTYEKKREDMKEPPENDEFKEKMNELAEQKQLMLLNDLYLMRTEEFQSIQEPEKTQLKNAIDENLANFNLFFIHRLDGKALLRTDRFKNLPLENKQQIYGAMINGILQIRQRILMEEKLKEGVENPTLKAFLEGELAMQRKNHLQAYTKYKQFLTLAEQDPQNAAPEQLQRARQNMYISSLEITKIAENFLIGILQNREWSRAARGGRNEKFPAGEDGLKIINKVRELLLKGEAASLDEAFQKADPAMYEFFKNNREHEQPNNPLVQGGMHQILGRLLNATNITDGADQKKEITRLANFVRRFGLSDRYSIGNNSAPEAARVLFQLAMQDDLYEVRRRYQMMQVSTEGHGRTPANWVEGVQDFLRTKELKPYWSEIEDAEQKLKAKTEDLFGRIRFDTQAKEIAYAQSGGKAAFDALSQENKNRVLAEIKRNLMQNALDEYEEELVFSTYLKSDLSNGNEAARDYKSMVGHGRWQISDAALDRAIDFGKEALLIGASMGVGRVVGKGVVYLGERATASLAARGVLAARGARAASYTAAGLGFASGEILTFHTAHSALQYAYMGHDTAFESETYWKGLGHAAILVSTLAVGGRFVTPTLVKATSPYKGIPAEMLTRAQRCWAAFQARMASVLVFEAPTMATLNGVLDNQGQSFLQRYYESLIAIAQFEMGTRMFNRATGNLAPRTAENIAMRAKVYKLRASGASGRPVDTARAEILSDMIKNRTVPIEAMHTLVNLKPGQMRAIQEFIAENAGLKLAIELSSKGGEIPAEMRPAYNQLVSNLTSMGLNNRQATLLLKSLTADKLIPIQRSYIEAAKEYLIQNKERIIRYLQNSNNLRAFVTFIREFNGNYQKFLNENPRLARLLPRDFAKLGILSAAVITAVTGNPLFLLMAPSMMIFKSRFRVGSKHKIIFEKSSHTIIVENLEIVSEHVDPQTNQKFFTVKNPRTGEVRSIWESQFKDQVEHARTRIKERQELAAKLRKNGMVEEANRLASVSNLFCYYTGIRYSTIPDARIYVDNMIAFHNKAKQLKKLGLNWEYQRLFTDRLDHTRHTLEVYNLRIDTMGLRIQAIDAIIHEHGKLKDMQRTLLNEASDLISIIRNLTNFSIDIPGTNRNLLHRIEFAQNILKRINEIKSFGSAVPKERMGVFIRIMDPSSNRGREIYELLNQRSAAIKNNDANTITQINKQLARRLTAFLGGRNVEQIFPMVVKLGAHNLLKEITSGRTNFNFNEQAHILREAMHPQDFTVLQAGHHALSPEMLHNVLNGGETFSAAGKTVRVFKGIDLIGLGQGGYGSVSKIFYVEGQSTTLKEAVAKTPHQRPDAVVNFGFEGSAADSVRTLIQRSSDPGSAHIIKPIFVSKDIIIYERITDASGRSTNLLTGIETMGTKNWLINFAGGVEGLAYLHRNNIAHNDFKPDNIVIGRNGGVLIDIGSTVNSRDIGTKVQTRIIPGTNQMATFYIDQMGNTHWIPQAPRFNDPNLLGNSVARRLPLDVGDKYAVGKSIEYMFESKGYLTGNMPPGIVELHQLSQKLQNAQAHPYKYRNNNRHEGMDTNYISLNDVPAMIERIASTLP